MIIWFALYDLNATLFISLLYKTLSEKNCDPIFGHNPPVKNHCSGSNKLCLALLYVYFNVSLFVMSF